LNRYEISAVSPTVYAQRFLRFIRTHTNTSNVIELHKQYNEAYQDIQARSNKNKHKKAKKKKRKDYRSVDHAGGRKLLAHASRSSSMTDLKDQVKDQIDIKNFPQITIPVPLPGLSQSNRASDIDVHVEVNIDMHTSQESEVPHIHVDTVIVPEAPILGDIVEVSQSRDISEDTSNDSEPAPSTVVGSPEESSFFEVRVPKRKRVIEKSRQSTHMKMKNYDSE